MSSSLPGSLMPAGPPRSVAQLFEEGGNFEYSDYVRLRNWLRTARQIRQQAEIYEEEGNIQQAFLLFYRQYVLVLERLPSHPEVKQSSANRKLLLAAKHDVEITLAHLERLKPRIKEAHERYLKKQEEAAQRRLSAESRKYLDSTAGGRLAPSRSPRHSRSSSASFDDSHHAVYYEGHEHPDLALRVARQAQGYPPSPVRTRQSVGDEYSLEQDMQRIRLQLDGRGDSAADRPPLPPRYESQSGRTAYPSVPLARPVPQSTFEQEWREEMDHREENWQAPSRPQKIPMQGYEPAPTLPPKEGAQSNSYSQNRYSPPPPNLPPRPKSTETVPPPKQQVFKPSAYLENGVPLRSVFFPPALRRDFLSLAKANTSKKIETCGILCGFLKNNALFISTLVVPEQLGTTDTCEMTLEGEIALFDWVDSRDLLTLGWIHTHPTQTCFMSSRDLHTHCGYQSMIQESIAVVCAPSIRRNNGDTDYGIFRLTDPPGMPCVRKCTDSRVFHPHNADNLYTDCQRPGHVVELEGLSYQVHDLRGGKS